ncbi:MAG: hypothetical protein B7X41_01245, partial [Microbacterium sp. 14-71-5]
MVTEYGTPASSLQNSGFLGAGGEGRARAGSVGEQKVAGILRTALRHSPATLLHDLRIPDARGANIDHAVISGRTVTLVDAKNWVGGTYWTLGGRTRRGLTATPHVDKRTLPLAVAKLDRLFLSRGVTVKFTMPLIAVISSNGVPLRFMFARAQEARLIPAERLAHQSFGRKPADPAIV